jgi:hypothetical protein
MTFSEYTDGLRQAYEGELVGDRLYRLLAMRSAENVRRSRLAAIADVERCTHTVLAPIALRLQIHPVEADLRSRVERRVLQLERLSWPEFIEKALVEWPPYIAGFEALELMAPPGDGASLAFVVKHERVLVEFARLEHDDPGSAQALDLLESFARNATA